MLKEHLIVWRIISSELSFSELRLSESVAQHNQIGRTWFYYVDMLTDHSNMWPAGGRFWWCCPGVVYFCAWQLRRWLHGVTPPGRIRAGDGGRWDERPARYRRRMRLRQGVGYQSFRRQGAPLLWRGTPEARRRLAGFSASPVDQTSRGGNGATRDSPPRC